MHSNSTLTFCNTLIFTLYSHWVIYEVHCGPPQGGIPRLGSNHDFRSRRPLGCDAVWVYHIIVTVVKCVVARVIRRMSTDLLEPKDWRTGNSPCRFLIGKAAIFKRNIMMYFVFYIWNIGSNVKLFKLCWSLSRTMDNISKMQRHW